MESKDAPTTREEIVEIMHKRYDDISDPMQAFLYGMTIGYGMQKAGADPPGGEREGA